MAHFDRIGGSLSCGFFKEEIKEYLSNDQVVYKKLLTTPEGYRDKVKPVMAEIFDYVLKEYYLLIDECERTIQDVDYRAKITAPFDDLFDFKHKGLISATTLSFSDPRFADFTHYLIVPKYTYQKPLTLMTTNNIAAAFKAYLLSTPSDRYFIFCSSLSAITALIDTVVIKDKSKIHCSEAKVVSLKYRGFKAEHLLDTSKLAKYNFFTSRFYSAVDIELDYKPEVLMVTEVVFAEHSILDPQTEVIQIVGRFRKGVNTITHITNFNPRLEVKTPEQIRSFLDGQQEVYRQILKLKETMRGEGELDAIDQIFSQTQFAKYFAPDGSYNWFMLDNYIQRERVLNLYRFVPNLIQAYDLVADHFKVTVDQKFFQLSDEDKLRKQSAQNRKDEIEAVVRELEIVSPAFPNYSAIFLQDLRNDLSRVYPGIVEAYNTIGVERITELRFNERRIARAVERYKKEIQYFKPKLLKAIDKKFREGEFYTEIYIESTLQDIYDRQGLKCEARPADIKKYFKASRTSRKTSENMGYMLVEQLIIDPFTQAEAE